ncbi:hypothetical protein D5F01_LYC23851 [Larimichthys crocea]|uniref:PiggyBac transposable element-derived protein domain-containing protein n=1 Tax=Larimichthys crocea TaxID=215358 RepID=A0A6G0HGC6_LARCR|nr:hypothetical protein D5F01_LYC23851 [Larimichthys crocea]
MDTKEVAGRHEEPLRTQAFRHSGKDRANAVRRMTGEYEARRGGEEKSERNRQNPGKTNRESLRKYGRHSWKRMDEIDLHAYMGLLILAGVYRSRGEAPASLWDAESGRAIFRATMSLKVFHIYSKLVRFDDRKTSGQTGGEKGLGRSWVACKARSSYAWKMQVYTGKKPNTAAGRGGEEEEGRKKGKGRGGSEKNQAMRLVLNVTEGLTGRNIICDNFFTSYKLAQRLLLEKNKTLLGTIRKNKPELPDALLGFTFSFSIHSLIHSTHSYSSSIHRHIVASARTC